MYREGSGNGENEDRAKDDKKRETNNHSKVTFTIELVTDMIRGGDGDLDIEIKI